MLDSLMLEMITEFEGERAGDNPDGSCEKRYFLFDMVIGGYIIIT
jgi:hypothetical protein